MLIKEQISDHDDNTLIVKKTHDATSAVNLARHLRDANPQAMSDSVPVGVIPAALLENWLMEAGVSWDNHDAVEEIISRKLMSGEFGRLRPWEGRF